MYIVKLLNYNIYNIIQKYFLSEWIFQHPDYWRSDWHCVNKKKGKWQWIKKKQQQNYITIFGTYIRVSLFHLKIMFVLKFGLYIWSLEIDLIYLPLLLFTLNKNPYIVQQPSVMRKQYTISQRTEWTYDQY